MVAAEREAPSPRPPDPALQEAIEAKASTLGKPAVASPWWSSIVARNSERFVGAALVPVDPGVECLERMPPCIWYIAVMSQSPVDVQVLECLHDTTCPPLESLSPADVPREFGLSAYRHAFKYCSASQVPVLCSGDARFGVVHVCWIGNRLVVMSAFVEFDVYTAPFATVMRPTRSGRGAARAQVDDEVLRALAEEFPWLTKGEIRDFLEVGHQQGLGQRSGHTGERPREVGPPLQLAAAVEEAASDVLEALQEKRELHGTAADKDLYFYVKLLGGLWTAAHKGVPS